MVTKKRRASRPKTRTVYRTAPRKTYRRKSGITDIPAAAATVALVAANVQPIKNFVNISNQWGWFKNPRAVAIHVKDSGLLSQQQLVKDAVAVAGGYIGGEVVKKYAPSVIKSPLGKLAKKLPKVF